MGLITEYSNIDEFVYGYREPEPVPSAKPMTTEKPEESTPQLDESSLPWAGGLVTLSVVVGFTAFFGLVMATGFIGAFVFVMQNPALLETQDPYATAQELVAPLEEAGVLSYTFSSIMYALSLIVAAAFVAYRIGWRWDKMGLSRLEPSRLSYALTIGGVGSLTMMGTALLVGGAMGATGNEITALREILSTANPLLLGVAVIASITLLPLGAELFFRGVVYTWMRARFGVIYGAGISALAYGFFNPTPIEFLPAVAVGAAMALVYQRTGSLWGAYFAHSAFNCVTIAIYWIALNAQF